MRHVLGDFPHANVGWMEPGVCEWTGVRNKIGTEICKQKESSLFCKI